MKQTQSQSQNNAAAGSAVIHGAFWAYAANYSGKALVFVSTVILARLLTQEDFGVAGYALVFIGFVEIFQGLGIGEALIYHHSDPQRTDTGFWLGLAVGVTLFAAAWLLAPLAGWYFQDPRAVPVTQLLALSFPITGLEVVHRALLQKQLAFRRIFAADLGKALSKGVTAISLALLGFGWWSLIWGQLAGAAVSVIALWIVVRWRPSFRFAPGKVRSLVTYGGSIVTVRTLGILLLNVDYLLIGRFLGAAALGVYTIAFRIPELLIKQFSGVVARVVFPAYAQMREDTAALQRGFLQTMRYVAIVTVPLGLGMALVADPFVRVVFSDKWIEAVPVLATIALYTMLRSLTFNAGDVYKAQGRPELLTKLSLVQLVVLLPALSWAVTGPQSLLVVGLVQTAVALFGALLNMVVAGRMLSLSAAQMLRALQPAAVGGFFLVLAVLVVMQLTAGMLPLLRLVTAVAAGALAYGGALWLLQRQVVLRTGHTLRAALPGR